MYGDTVLFLPQREDVGRLLGRLENRFGAIR